MARELTIQYGGFIISDATGRQVDGIVQYTKGFVTTEVEFKFVTAKAVEADFKAEIDTIEDAFRTPRQDLTIVQGAQTILSLSHGSSTGFDAEPEIVKREDAGNTGRSRRYTVRIRFGMPANLGVTASRRDSRVSVEYLPSRRRKVTITATYTASGGTTARAQFNASIAAYATSVLTAIGGTYELVGEPVTEANDTNKVITGTRIYEELIYSQAGAVDDTAIVQQVLVIERQSPAPGDTFTGTGGGAGTTDGPQANRLRVLNCRFDCWIDKNVTQGLTAKWTAIKPWVLTQISNTLGAAAVALVDERPSFDYTDNRITVQLTVLGAGSSNILERRISVETHKVEGVTLVPAWTSNALSKYKHQGPATVQQTITDTLLVLAGMLDSDSLAASAMDALGAEETAVLVSKRTRRTPKRLGQDAYVIDVVEIERTTVYEFYAPVGAGTASGGNTESAAAGVSGGVEVGGNTGNVGPAGTGGGVVFPS